MNYAALLTNLAFTLWSSPLIISFLRYFFVMRVFPATIWIYPPNAPLNNPYCSDESNLLGPDTRALNRAVTYFVYSFVSSLCTNPRINLVLFNLSSIIGTSSLTPPSISIPKILPTLLMRADCITYISSIYSLVY